MIKAISLLLLAFSSAIALAESNVHQFKYSYDSTADVSEFGECSYGCEDGDLKLDVLFDVEIEEVETCVFDADIDIKLDFKAHKIVDASGSTISDVQDALESGRSWGKKIKIKDKTIRIDIRSAQIYSVWRNKETPAIHFKENGQVEIDLGEDEARSISINGKAQPSLGNVFFNDYYPKDVSSTRDYRSFLKYWKEKSAECRASVWEPKQSKQEKAEAEKKRLAANALAASQHKKEEQEKYQNALAEFHKVVALIGEKQNSPTESFVATKDVMVARTKRDGTIYLFQLIQEGQRDYSYYLFAGNFALLNQGKYKTFEGDLDQLKQTVAHILSQKPMDKASESSNEFNWGRDACTEPPILIPKKLKSDFYFYGQDNTLINRMALSATSFEPGLFLTDRNGQHVFNMSWALSFKNTQVMSDAFPELYDMAFYTGAAQHIYSAYDLVNRATKRYQQGQCQSEITSKLDGQWQQQEAYLAIRLGYQIAPFIMYPAWSESCADELSGESVKYNALSKKWMDAQTPLVQQVAKKLDTEGMYEDIKKAAKLSIGIILNKHQMFGVTSAQALCKKAEDINGEPDLFFGQPGGIARPSLDPDLANKFLQF
ncbi:hypothetical protein [Litoribrevibacter albus]|uniref:Uncharacterized protein n=1 Tax=Litoribrevibacter albus TaxID=1473156 RepID=A0AA37S6Q3_9GAMM|nr:hypothetical protein [Litoribrevibacter albus]GLQ30225.1 hypothetical protein GCM10007876_07030 [Litoribrevibacter albus]